MGAEEVGLTLHEGKAILAKLQRCLVQSQIDDQIECARVCTDCMGMRQIRDSFYTERLRYVLWNGWHEEARQHLRDLKHVASSIPLLHRARFERPAKNLLGLCSEFLGSLERGESRKRRSRYFNLNRLEMFPVLLR